MKPDGRAGFQPLKPGASFLIFLLTPEALSGVFFSTLPDAERLLHARPQSAIFE